jgi:hypothetical protein
MCEACYNIDVTSLVDSYKEKVETLTEMSEVIHDMTERDASFARDLISQFLDRGNLSSKQWEWVGTLKDRIKGVKPIYGSFNAISVMFRLAGEKLKYPKIRLITKNDQYILLSFKKVVEGKNTIEIATGGYANHGRRVFRGWIENGAIVPYKSNSIDDDIEMTLQEFALDPVNVAKAHSKILGACVFCGKPLTDEKSKALGYGPVCAKNYGLPTKLEK